MQIEPNLLIADDEAINCEMVTAILHPLGWKVACVDDGAAAVEAARNGLFAVVLMDIQMPVLDGYGAARAIRSEPGPARSVPIVAFTSLKVADPLAHFRAAGMDDYLEKPFTPVGLRAAVLRWWPEPESDNSSQLAEIFGAGELAGLLRRFRTQLVEALDVLDRNPADLRAFTHRLGGLAGTLGFTGVSDRLLAVSDGDDAAVPRARVEVRKAIMLIDRG